MKFPFCINLAQNFLGVDIFISVYGKKVITTPFTFNINFNNNRGERGTEEVTRPPTSNKKDGFRWLLGRAFRGVLLSLTVLRSLVLLHIRLYEGTAECCSFQRCVIFSTIC